MKKARSTTQEERLQIVKECMESGRNYGEMAQKYNVSYNTRRVQRNLGVLTPMDKHERYLAA